MQARARGMKLRREKAAALKAAREEKVTVIPYEKNHSL